MTCEAAPVFVRWPVGVAAGWALLRTSIRLRAGRAAPESGGTGNGSSVLAGRQDPVHPGAVEGPRSPAAVANRCRDRSPKGSSLPRPRSGARLGPLLRSWSRSTSRRFFGPPSFRTGQENKTGGAATALLPSLQLSRLPEPSLTSRRLQPRSGARFLAGRSRRQTAWRP